MTSALMLKYWENPSNYLDNSKEADLYCVREAIWKLEGFYSHHLRIRIDRIRELASDTLKILREPQNGVSQSYFYPLREITTMCDHLCGEAKLLVDRRLQLLKLETSDELDPKGNQELHLSTQNISEAIASIAHRISQFESSLNLFARASAPNPKFQKTTDEILKLTQAQETLINNIQKIETRLNTCTSLAAVTKLNSSCNERMRHCGEKIFEHLIRLSLNQINDLKDDKNPFLSAVCIKAENFIKACQHKSSILVAMNIKNEITDQPAHNTAALIMTSYRRYLLDQSLK